MPFTSRPRHPVTGARFRLRARTAAELGMYLHRVEGLRTELKLGIKSPQEVEDQLRHLQHGPVTLERAARSYLERPLADNTKRRTRSLMATHLAPLLKRPIASLDVPTVSAWIEAVERGGLHGTSAATVWRSLRALVRHAAERGWIGASPWGSWRPRLGRAPKRELREAARSPEELARLLAAAAELDAAGGRGDLEALIACAALLGLRQGELAGLRWDDVDAGEPPSVLIARQYAGDATKGGKRPVRIETIRELLVILAGWCERLARAGLFDARGPIFPHPKSVPGRPRPYASGAVLTSLRLRSAVRRAGLPHFGSWSPHSLRDTFVTLESAAAGADLRQVQDRSRHASLASLARYLRDRSRNTPASPAVKRLPTIPAGDEGPPRLGPHR